MSQGILDGDRLPLIERRDDGGRYYVIPLPHNGSAIPAGPLVELSLAEALRARIHPLGTAETVLRAWASEDPLPSVAYDDPTEVPPVRVRAGAVVIADEHMLLIRHAPGKDGHTWYSVPGGAMEPGETPERAALRELREETGLSGTVRRELARVYKDGREEHYYLVDAAGEAERRDLPAGQSPVWVDVAALPTTPAWPKRLMWRITTWHINGWPDRPAEFADSITDLRRLCFW